MLSTIQKLLKQYSPATDKAEPDSDAAVRMATVALLMEVARADTEVSDAEQQAILRIVERYYSVPSAQARDIVAAATNHAEDATSLHPFTRLITTECSLEDRIGIVRLLWKVTFADGHVDAHEEHLVRKVADLLYVPHSHFIRTRHQESSAADK